MADDASAWTEHTHNDGRRYYYNKTTKASSWDKPECLKSGEERANTTSWKEYKAADGRDYFYNPITKQSVWEMPIELKRLRGLVNKDEESEDEGSEKDEEPEYATPEARRAAFKELLDDKNVKPTAKWEEALKLIQEDRRFNALATAGEKKQVFAEWAPQARKRKQEEERDKKRRAKDDWLDTLRSWEDLKPNSRYRDAAEAFHELECFKLMEEDDRDDLFQDFMDESEKKIKDDRRKQRKEYVEKVKNIYDETEEITVSSRWRDVQKQLADDETFKWLSKLEALTSWEEWVQDNTKKELEAKRSVKYRTERINRDAFRELLKEQLEAEKLKPGTRWREVVQNVHKDTRYVNMIGLSGSTPHDLLDDFMDELGERYKEDRAKIKKWAKAKGLVVTSTSTYEWFHDQLQDEDGFSQIPADHRTMFFESLLQKAKEQDEEAEKNAKKNRKRFVELLQRTREVTAKTTYEGAAKLLGSTDAWESVDEPTRRQCFDIFVDQLKIQSASRRDDDGSAEEDAPPKAKEKKREKDAGKPVKKARREEPLPEPEEPRKAKKSRREVEEEEPPEKPAKKSKKQR